MKPTRHRLRKLSPHLKEEVYEEINKLKTVGFIREVQYPEWIANIVVVKKTNGKIRICIDYKNINEACPKDSFPLPHIDQLVSSTAGHELISMMDGYSGYNQIPLYKEGQEKTSFITDRGTFCFKVMSFGLRNAGATYERLVTNMFTDFIGKTAEVYINDMVVKSKKEADHATDLENAFKILRQYNMKLNPNKCTFDVRSGKFLGYMLTERGIEVDPSKIKAVLDMPAPKTKKQI